jgi:hypothetical protein
MRRVPYVYACIVLASAKRIEQMYSNSQCTFFQLEFGLNLWPGQKVPSYKGSGTNWDESPVANPCSTVVV